MSNHQQVVNQTYSLRGILDANIDPVLCKLMLHQIKSPLLEHSFQITTDDQRNTGSFIKNNSRTRSQYDYEQAVFSTDRTPDQERPATTNRNHGQNKALEDYSVTNSYYEASKLEHPHPKQQNTEGNNQPHFILDGVDMQAVVSPLQHYRLLNQNLPSSNNDEFHIKFKDFFSSEQQQAPKGPNMAQLCGKVFATDLDPMEIEVAPRAGPRRKIFKNRDHSYAPFIRRITFSEAVEKLNNIGENQLSNFISFLSKVLPIFHKLVPYRNGLRINQSLLHKMLLKHSPVDYLTRATIPNEKRIGNRVMGGSGDKMSELLNALISGPVQWQKLHQYRNSNSNSFSETLGQDLFNLKEGKSEEKVEQDLQITLQCFSQIEEIVEDYVSREKSVEELEIVHSLLYSNSSLFIDPSAAAAPSSRVNSPIANMKFTEEAEQSSRLVQQNDYTQSDNSPCLLSKLNYLLQALHIDEVFYQQTSELCYLWPHIFKNGYYDRRPSEFVQQICKNDILVRKPERRAPNPGQKSFGQKLQKQGYERNR